MSTRARHRRAPDQCRRRLGATGTLVGITVGGAMAAAFVSMNTASADDLLAPATDDDAFTDLAQTIDPNAFTTAGAPYDFIGTLANQSDSLLAPTVFGPELDTIASQVLAGDFSAPATDDDPFTGLAQAIDPNALTAAGDPNGFVVGGAMAAAALPAQTTLDSFEQLVQTYDGFAFTSTGAPNDIIGTIASQIDSDLANASTAAYPFYTELNTISGQILAGDFSAPLTTDEDGFEDMVQAFVDPNAFTSVCDTTGTCTPVDPTIWFETLAYQLDTLLAPSVYGPELDTIADQIISIFTTTVF